MWPRVTKGKRSAFDHRYLFIYAFDPAVSASESDGTRLAARDSNVAKMVLLELIQDFILERLECVKFSFLVM